MYFKLYILRFPTKLLVKLRFPNFRIILRLYSPLTICASQKQQQKKKEKTEKRIITVPGRDMVSGKVTSFV